MVIQFFSSFWDIFNSSRYPLPSFCIYIDLISSRTNSWVVLLVIDNRWIADVAIAGVDMIAELDNAVVLVIPWGNPEVVADVVADVVVVVELAILQENLKHEGSIQNKILFFDLWDIFNNGIPSLVKILGILILPIDLEISGRNSIWFSKYKESESVWCKIWLRWIDFPRLGAVSVDKVDVTVVLSLIGEPPLFSTIDLDSSILSDDLLIRNNFLKIFLVVEDLVFEDDDDDDDDDKEDCCFGDGCGGDSLSLDRRWL